MQKEQRAMLRATSLLFIAAFIWGTAFVAQRVGSFTIEPFTFNGVRVLLAGLSLLPVVLILEKRKGKNGTKEPAPLRQRPLIWGGLICGVILFAASSLQQIGIGHTTAGKAGFITALYVIFVPLIGLFTGRRIRLVLWLCILATTIGLYLLCIKEDFSINKGDALVLASAVFYALHIIAIDRFSPRVGSVHLSCAQFFVAGIISVIFMFAFESPDVSALLACWFPLMYAGILSCGVAYTCQIMGQRRVSPAATSLILCLEAVFAAVAGWVILRELLTLRELAGCIIILGAVAVSQLPRWQSKPSPLPPAPPS